MDVIRRTLFEGETLRIGPFEARPLSDACGDVEQQSLNAVVLPFSGPQCIFSGAVSTMIKDSPAIAHAAHAMRLSPLDHQVFAMQTVIASAHFCSGRYEEACLWATKSLQETPNFLPALRIAAASNALAGRIAEAQRAMVCVCKIDPKLRVSNLKDWFAFRRPEDLARIEEGLRKAGLPE